jgi:hypothetical protein
MVYCITAMGVAAATYIGLLAYAVFCFRRVNDISRTSVAVSRNPPRADQTQVAPGHMAHPLTCRKAVENRPRGL